MINMNDTIHVRFWRKRHGSHMVDMVQEHQDWDLCTVRVTGCSYEMRFGTSERHKIEAVTAMLREAHRAGAASVQHAVDSMS